MKLKYATLALLAMLLVLSILIGTTNVHAQNNYYVTIKPTASSPSYTSVGNNWTLSFSANWTFGNQNGQPVQNATVVIEVRSSEDIVLEILEFDTDSMGIFAFNYSSTNADILSFIPISLTTLDEQEYTTETIDGVFGIKAESAIVWYDIFHVELVSYDVNHLGKTVAMVNVTYRLLPEEGLTLPDQTFLPKIVHDATVTINGVVATEFSQGIFTAESSAYMDTVYVNVKVFQDYWKTTDTAFCFTHSANQQIWMYCTAFVSVAIFAVLALYYTVYRKANDSSLKYSNKLFFGFILLLVTSLLSLYWGIVAIEGTLHTFNWFLLALACMFSFAFGLMGSVLVLRKKVQPLSIFTPIVPLIINTVIVKAALDGSQLTSPWLMLFFSTILSAVCIFFISSSDKALQKSKQIIEQIKT
ncbi:MAG: hypothetical protein FWG55_07780 [Candidatus Bathyarchaeota archaeon]|nr:hypothetical protein [Candidatus Termiticorpusculum sp.]